MTVQRLALRSGRNYCEDEHMACTKDEVARQ